MPARELVAFATPGAGWLPSVGAMAFNLADLFEVAAAAVPQRVAATDGRVTRTFAELDERAGRLAAELVDRGVERGDRVAVALADRVAFLESLLAAWKCGAVPFNVHRHYVLDELHRLLEHAAPRLVLAEPGQGRAMAAASAVVVEHDDDLEACIGRRRPLVGVQRSGDDLYLLYTGGSTGVPKGVLWRHEDLFFAALGGGNLAGGPITRPEELALHLAAAPVGTFVAAPLSHGTAQWAALAALLAGGSVHLPGTAHFNATAALAGVAATGASHLVLVGDAFAVPLADALDAEPDRFDLSALLVIASGGAPLSTLVALRLLEHLPGALVVDGYGSTETGGQARRVISPGVDQPGLARFTPGAGSAVLGTGLRPLEPGSREVGQLARRGHVPLGYRDDPVATSRTFPTVDGVRWALSGDLGRVDADGRVTVLGRSERLINSGGEKVYPGEVEAAISSHPDVEDVLVIPLAHPRFGQEVAALVRLREGATLSLEGLRQHCHGTLARFKLPRRLAVVGEVPRTSAGKPDYLRAVDLFDQA